MLTMLTMLTFAQNKEIVATYSVSLMTNKEYTLCTWEEVETSFTFYYMNNDMQICMISKGEANIFNIIGPIEYAQTSDGDNYKVAHLSDGKNEYKLEYFDNLDIGVILFNKDNSFTHFVNR